MSGMTTRAIERTVTLLADPPPAPDTSRGYLDLVGDGWVEPASRHQTLMNSPVVARIYRRWWRPVLKRLVTGLSGPSKADEQTMIRQALRLEAGDTVLDAACGSGNFTRDLGQQVGDGGLAVGLDLSSSMAATAVREAAGPNVAYVRGDAVRLPFADGVFDAIFCFGALHHFSEPFTALDHMVRVLVPGGRIVIFTSAAPGAGSSRLARAASEWLTKPGGIQLFERDEITRALAERGAHNIRQRIFGSGQYVSAQTRVH
jgi:ubiquinone/menaquinone biosynthesis C-methylase UbiE